MQQSGIVSKRGAIAIAKARRISRKWLDDQVWGQANVVSAESRTRSLLPGGEGQQPRDYDPVARASPLRAVGYGVKL